MIVASSRLIKGLLGTFFLLAVAGCASNPKDGFIRPVEGTFTSGYGPRGAGHHHGVDWAAKRGTPVRAAKGGKGVFRGKKRGGGRLIIIDHGQGVQTYYAHLSGFKTRKGRKVRRGELIGKVGSSGRSSGPHLHFEIRMNGKSVNPAGLVPLR